MTVNLRYFAAAAEAAGVAEDRVSLPEGATVADLRAALVAMRGEDFAKQLAISALLIDGAHAADDALLPAGEIRADVLPPFAGG
jgi:ThiS family.